MTLITHAAFEAREPDWAGYTQHLDAGHGRREWPCRGVMVREATIGGRDVLVCNECGFEITVKNSAAIPAVPSAAQEDRW